MEFLSLNRRRSSSRNVPSGEERGETDVFAGYHFHIWMDTLKRIEEIIQQNAYPNLILDALKRIEKIIQENSLEQKKNKTLNLITG